MKYTLIYSRSVALGTNRVFSVHYQRVEVKSLEKYVSEYEAGDIQLIFMGWPKIEGEEISPTKL